MLRIVHAADIHLDTPYRRHDEAVRARLREAGREAFTRLVDLALEREVDALLLAGDLFDNEWLTLATERVLVDELTRATNAGLTVVYATGNHDPGRANYRAMGIGWPEERFHVVASRQPRSIAVEREGDVVGWVVAAGHQTPHEDRDLAAAFPPAPGPEPAVALLHAQVMSAAAAEQHDRYAPTTLDGLDPSYAYWALGHIHQRQEVRRDPPVYYPGNVQGRHPAENGAKGALVVTLDRGAAPEVEFHALAPVRWETLEPEGLDAARNSADVQAAVRCGVRRATGRCVARPGVDSARGPAWRLSACVGAVQTATSAPSWPRNCAKTWTCWTSRCATAACIGRWTLRPTATSRTCSVRRWRCWRARP